MPSSTLTALGKPQSLSIDFARPSRLEQRFRV
jgi:predicted 3-demethylubiquinone-9 3-methyltransferase (glyoxalase superfamily)